MPEGIVEWLVNPQPIDSFASDAVGLKRIRFRNGFSEYASIPSHCPSAMRWLLFDRMPPGPHGIG
jgi:hypothetical protein